MSLLLGLVLAASFDGEAALRHASFLAELGPRHYGTPRARSAAEYVASMFREVGLADVRLQEFKSKGIPGTNVLGVLRGSGPEFVVVAAHHDSAPPVRWARDDGSGVAVLIETARALAQRSDRPRTVVFASFDGEEAWFTGQLPTGSAAYVESLGGSARDLVAALVMDVDGSTGGAPVIHPLLYADPARPGTPLSAPAWLVEAALVGSGKGGSRPRVGGSFLAWLYQPALRTFKITLHGDDLSFLRSGLPALLASDSSLRDYYPGRQHVRDPDDALSIGTLERAGDSILGIVDELGRVPRGAPVDSIWFAAGGRLFRLPALVTFCAFCALPGLVLSVRGGALALGLRLMQALLFAFALWRHPLPAAWVLAAPTLLTALPLPRWLTAGLGLIPALALAALGLIGRSLGAVTGSWVAPWEAMLLLLALMLLGAPLRASGAARGKTAEA
jgi:hypothetical protein